MNNYDLFLKSKHKTHEHSGFEIKNLNSSPYPKDESPRKIYSGATLSPTQTKQCEYCGGNFLIYKTAQLKIRFCGKSCSAKWRMRQPEHLAKVHNKEVAAKRGKSIAEWLKTDAGKIQVDRIRNLKPMLNPETRAKVSATLKEMGHQPSVRGGNGRGMTRPQKLMKGVLAGNWIPEYAISLGKLKAGYPTNYKVDLANLDALICIEVDGSSHHSRKDLDKKKDAKLTSLGWKVLRFWNKDILNWIDAGMGPEHSISSTLKLNGIQIIR